MRGIINICCGCFSLGMAMAFLAIGDVPGFEANLVAVAINILCIVAVNIPRRA